MNRAIFESCMLLKLLLTIFLALMTLLTDYAQKAQIADENTFECEEEASVLKGVGTSSGAVFSIKRNSF